ncbi:cation channel sperm-associated protein subunit delta isoform X7 [Bos indicus x Bos taurus]|uniref:cation channel sperm-associated protein subunit delta isoform X7 n=1 Tax=Bos indicus x Bos taurus TaxID=30522 RepID=UPI000F7D2AF7|nr:cation channel sperm-associated protein subunit delta isoform X7 [Bos indicus x Bos taurus]
MDSGFPGDAKCEQKSIRTLRTGKVFPVEEKTQGDRLYFSSGKTHLIKHPCKKNLALYLGRQIFLTKDTFESSLIPFSIPTSMQVGTPEVTSAHFAGSVLLLVVNQKVYVYDYEANFWTASTGIQHPVSHVSGDNCCYSGNSFCMDISNSVFAYLRGDQVSQANIYFSNSRGYRFQKYTQERRAELVGTFGGIFSFHSLSQVGLLLVDEQMAMFSYSDHPLNRSFGLPFDYDRALDILIAPGQKGILIFWSEKNLLVSRNSGQLVESVQVREGQRILYNSIVKANITIHSVAANENELAVLTEENNLYYGSLGIQSSSLIKFADQNIWSQEAVLMFTDVGMLEILTPLRDVLFPAFDFQKCRLNIQALLMDPQLQAGVCKVELLQGEFENKMYTIDMNSQLELTALMIPRPGMLPVPLVRTLYLFDKCLNICHPWPHVSCPQFPGSGNSLASSQRDTGSRSPQRLLLFLQTPASTCRRGCPSAHPASFLCTSMLVLQPPSELPRTLSKNAFSSQLSQRWLSRLQGMPEKKWASLDLKPRCPNLDPWVQAIKLKTGEWSNVKIPGDVQSAGTRARERSRPGRRILPCALTRTPQAPSLHRTSLSAHEGPVWVLWHFSLRLSSQRASEPQLGGIGEQPPLPGAASGHL